MAASIWNGSTAIGSTANADNTILQQRFATPAEGQVLFPLTLFTYAVGTNSLRVFVNGVRQFVNTDYTETSTSSFTFTSGVEASDIIDAEGVIGVTGATNAANSASAAAASAVSAAASAAMASALVPANLPLSRANGGMGQATPAPVSGKVLGSTDGINFSMVALGIGLVNAITANTTLTAATIGYHAVAMVALGSSVTLPDATTLNVGGPRAIIDNTKGAYPVGIRDSAGTLIMAISPGGEALVSLRDNSTAAGVWSVTGSNLEPGLITIDSTFSSATYTATAQAPFVTLDNNTSIHFATLQSGGFAAFVVDNAGKVLTTPVTVDATAASVPVQAYKISATAAIVFFGVTNTCKAAVLTLTGNSPTFSLSVGTTQTATPASGNINGVWDGEDFKSAPKIAQLASNLYLASFTTGGVVTTGCVAMSVAGATITMGAGVTIIAAAATTSTTTYALTAAAALVLYKSGAAAPYDNNAVVISVAGTVCTVNAPVVVGLTSSSTVPSSSCLLSPTKAICVDNVNAGISRAVALTIAGTVITAGAFYTIDNTSALSLYTDGSATRYNPHVFPLSANTALFWALDTSNYSRVFVLTEAAGVITAGTGQYGSISQTSTFQLLGSVFPFGTAEYLSFRSDGIASTGTITLRAVCNKIAGSTLTGGANVTLTDAPSINAAALTRLASGDYLVSASTVASDTSAPAKAISVLRTNGDAINYRGSIKLPTLGRANPIIPGTTSNRLVLIAATNEFLGGVSANKLRLLNVEIAA